MENSDFTDKIQSLISEKSQWFNDTALPEMLDNYRLLHTCVKNINDVLVKKSLIVPDPYRLDRRISEIVVPDTAPFSEGETAVVIGTRFSDYETMLDFICTYFRFSIENVTIQKIKKLIEFNSVFDWNALSTSNAKPNTQGLASLIMSARQNSPALTVGMLADCVEKAKSSVCDINKGLSMLADFQKEIYKCQVRRSVIGHPKFNYAEAFQSPDKESAEIRRMFKEAMGKIPFYNDLIQEIVNEDQGPNSGRLREQLAEKLKIKDAAKLRKTDGPDPRAMLMDAVFSLGGMAPTLSALQAKLSDNFELLFAKKNSIGQKIADLFRKVFKIQEKEKVCQIVIRDANTNASVGHKLKVNEFMNSVSAKIRLYNAIAARGPEFRKIGAQDDTFILNFLSRQISDNQKLFTIINALDDHFKANVDIMRRSKVKGLKIELSAMKNSMVNTNKRRGEYVSTVEEIEQMKKLGIHSDV